MKNDLEKALQETWEMKKAAQESFEKSGCKSYREFLKKELKDMKIEYHQKRSPAA